MKKLNLLYMLLVASALTLQVACDDSEEVTADPTPAAGETAGETPEAGDTAGETPEAGDPAGETPEAGDPAGETPEAGDTAGETPEAGDTAGMPMEERVGPGDTDPTSCAGDYCPSARLSGLELPQTKDEAYARGCRLASSKNGTALGGLLMLAGDVDTNEFVQPDADGNIQLVLLNHLKGWAEGMSGNNAGTLTANFYTGNQEEGGYSIDPVSFDENNEPIIFFDGTKVIDGLYQTPPSDFIVDLPVADLPLQLRLSQTEVNGFVTTDATGFNMTEGVLGGYLTRDAIIELIEGINAVCASDTPPDLCGTVSSFLSGNAEADLGLLVPILGGFDSAINGDDVSACEGDSPDCNAISVCILIEMESANITGVAAE